MSNSVNVQPKTFPQKKTKQKIAYSPIPKPHEYFQNPPHPHNPFIHEQSKANKKKEQPTTISERLSNTSFFVFRLTQRICNELSRRMICLCWANRLQNSTKHHLARKPLPQLQYVNCVKRWTKLFRGGWSGIELCVGRMFIPIKVRTDILHTSTTTKRTTRECTPAREAHELCCVFTLNDAIYISVFQLIYYDFTPYDLISCSTNSCGSRKRFQIDDAFPKWIMATIYQLALTLFAYFLFCFIFSTRTLNRWIRCVHYCVVRERNAGAEHWWYRWGSDGQRFSGHHTDAVLFIVRRWCSRSGKCALLL